VRGQVSANRTAATRSKALKIPAATAIFANVNDQGVALVKAVLFHAFALDLHEEGGGGVFDEMLIKAEVCCGSDDGEHRPMVHC